MPLCLALSSGLNPGGLCLHKRCAPLRGGGGHHGVHAPVCDCVHDYVYPVFVRVPICNCHALGVPLSLIVMGTRCWCVWRRLACAS